MVVDRSLWLPSHLMTTLVPARDMAGGQAVRTNETLVAKAGASHRLELTSFTPKVQTPAAALVVTYVALFAQTRLVVCQYQC